MPYDRVLSLIKQLELAILEMQSGCPPKKRKKRGTVSDHRDRLKQVIERAGRDGITSSLLLRSTTNISREVRIRLLDEMIAAGLVLKTVTKPVSDWGGRPTIRYTMAAVEVKPVVVATQSDDGEVVTSG